MQQLHQAATVAAAAAAECDFMFNLCSLALLCAAWPTAFQAVLQSPANLLPARVAPLPKISPPPLNGPKIAPCAGVACPAARSAAPTESKPSAPIVQPAQFSALGTSRLVRTHPSPALQPLTMSLNSAICRLILPPTDTPSGPFVHSYSTNPISPPPPHPSVPNLPPSHFGHSSSPTPCLPR